MGGTWKYWWKKVNTVGKIGAETIVYLNYE